MIFSGLDLNFKTAICDPARHSLAGDSDALGQIGVRALGLWWLSQSEAEPDQDKADCLFYEAVGLFFRDQATAGLSLEFFEKWVEARPRFAPAYQREIYQEIPDWRREHAQHERKHKREQKKRRDEWMQYFRSHLPKIRIGEAHPKVIHDLASAYFGRLIEAHGETELERLSKFLDDDSDLISAALNGFRCSLERPDLPTVHEILKLDRSEKIQLLTSLTFWTLIGYSYGRYC